jgi:serine/threonine-protein kinase
VLDFGLAKALGPDVGSAPDVLNSPTLTAPATQLGMIIGTAAYMAPEQARGKAVDRRADIWAFGAVLFEMLTGLRTFEGDDVSTTLASVLKRRAAVDIAARRSPSPLTRLLRRCLEKDPRRRLSAIGDARLELDEHEPVAAGLLVTAPASRPSMLSRLWPAAAGIVVTAVCRCAAMAVLRATNGSARSADVDPSAAGRAGLSRFDGHRRVTRRHDGGLHRRFRGSIGKRGVGSARRFDVGAPARGYRERGARVLVA